ncbi:MAG: hypothetical protein WBP55_00785 [Solirubrobacterales bacterium]
MSFSRVKPGEWVASLCGILILGALFMPWNGDETALESIGLLDILLTLVAVMALVLPGIVAFSSRPNLPITFETLMSDLATIVTAILVIRLIWAPDGGVKAGFLLGLIASVLLTVAGWRSTSRES